MEDDVYFPAQDGFEYFLKNKPDDFDIYLGGIYLGSDKVKEMNQRIRHRFSGLHCYIVHERFYDTFLLGLLGHRWLRLTDKYVHHQSLWLHIGKLDV